MAVQAVMAVMAVQAVHAVQAVMAFQAVMNVYLTDVALKAAVMYRRARRIITSGKLTCHAASPHLLGPWPTPQTSRPHRLSRLRLLPVSDPPPTCSDA